MIKYFICSTLCSGLLLMVYKLFLEKEKMHRFKRFYLLLAIVFSYSVPFIEIHTTVDVTTISQQLTQTDNVFTDPVSTMITMDFQSVAISIFCIVSISFFARLIYNFYQVISKVNSNRRLKYMNAIIILDEETPVPHSFLNYIFIGKTVFENNELEKEILHHELAHVNQGHSYDILFVEFIHCLCWVNPFQYFYKKAIQLNHEFLADEAVNNSFNNVFSYQNLLLEKVSMHKAINIASQFNFKITKKRLLMMTKTTSVKIRTSKQLAIVPIMLLSVYMFGNNVVVQKKIEDQNSKNQVENSIVRPQIKNAKSTTSKQPFTSGQSKPKTKPETLAYTEKIRLKKLSPQNSKIDRLDGNPGQLSPLTGSLQSQN